MKYTIDNHKHEYEIESGQESCKYCWLLRTTIESKSNYANYATTTKCPLHQCKNCGEVFKEPEIKRAEKMLKDLEESEKSGIAFSGTGEEALEYLKKCNCEHCRFHNGVQCTEKCDKGHEN